MKKNVSELIKKNTKTIEEEVLKLRTELTKLKLEAKAAPQKDTNAISKKRKRLALLLTILSQKRKEGGKNG